jgi:GDP-L-fucose synthase
MQQHQKIYVAGHRGMVGSALVRKLQALGYTNIVTRSSAELDLRNQAAVQTFFKEEQPAFVFMAAAKVGGIHANNTFRADFLRLFLYLPKISTAAVERSVSIRWSIRSYE